MDKDEYSERFLAGVTAFNRRDFFSAHEFWEGQWLECHDQSRDFYQGLIQVAVCLYHFGRGNTRGARKLYFSCRKYLDQYRPSHLGVDVNGLLVQLELCCAEIVLQTGDQQLVPTGQLDPNLLPAIDLS
jgi:hypothetical protein